MKAKDIPACPGLGSLPPVPPHGTLPSSGKQIIRQAFTQVPVFPGNFDSCIQNRCEIWFR